MQELLNYEASLINETPSEATEEIVIRKDALVKVALFAGILICLALAIII